MPASLTHFATRPARRPLISTAVGPAEPELLFFEGDGRTPNSCFPVLLYRGVLWREADRAAAFERRFAAHRWAPLWRAGVFDYHHYHASAHEALGIASGHAWLMLGGEAGREIHVRAGDALVLPAGTGHCCLEASEDFLVVGAYPRGQEDYDIQRAGSDRYLASVRRIAQVPTPVADPLTGRDGVLTQAWRVA
ncbi:cupin [Pseudomonas tohonis]|nr:hypothetical protein L682_20810 [Pseudomonas alcaligenes OT 69]MDN4147153.1 cupin [Pseudomonas tohonis]